MFFNEVFNSVKQVLVVCCTSDSPARHARSTLQSQCNHSSLLLYIGHTHTHMQSFQLTVSVEPENKNT